MKFDAEFYDGQTSRRQTAVAEFMPDNQLVIDLPDGPRRYDLDDIKIVPPLGSTPRILRLPGGAQCRTTNSAAIDEIERRAGRERGEHWIHTVEQNRGTILAAALSVILFCALVYLYGLPWLAKDIAIRLPPDMRQRLSTEAFAFLDKRFLRPSELEEASQARMQDLFAEIAERASDRYAYRLVIRRSRIGANAFALPDGLVLLTDELVKLADNDEQIRAVLAHEIGHVEHQHGLRMVIQNAGVLFITTVLLGDISSVYTLSGALPTLLANNAYSRQFESEADRYAAEYLIATGRSTEPLQQMLLMLEAEHESIPLEDILSSHPSIRKRVEAVQRLEESR